MIVSHSSFDRLSADGCRQMADPWLLTRGTIPCTVDFRGLQRSDLVQNTGIMENHRAKLNRKPVNRCEIHIYTYDLPSGERRA